MCGEESRIYEDSLVEERDGLDDVRDEVAHIVDQLVNTDSGDVTAEVLWNWFNYCFKDYLRKPLCKIA